MAKGLWSRLGQLFDREEEAASLTREEQKWEQSFGDRTLDQDAVDQTQQGRWGAVVHVISLAAFHDAVGSQWPDVAQRAVTITENAIQHHMAGTGFFRQQGADLFLLAFPTLSETEAKARTAAIADEAGKKLLGARFVSDGRPLVHAAEVPTDDLFDDSGAVRTSVAAAAVAEVRALDPEPNTTGPASPRAPAPAEPQSPPRRHGVAGSGRDNEISITFQPVWRRRTEAVDTYLVRGHRSVGGMIFSGSLVHPAEAGGDFLGQLDRALVRETVRRMPAAARNKVTVVLPLSLGGVTGPHGPRILEALAALPEGLASLWLVLVLVNVAPGQDKRLGDALAALDRYCQAVGVGCERLPPREALRAGAAWLGVDAEHHRLRSDLLAGVARGANQGATPFVWNVPDKESLASAVSQGVAAVSGPALSTRELETPGRAVPVPWAKLAG